MVNNQQNAFSQRPRNENAKLHNTSKEKNINKRTAPITDIRKKSSTINVDELPGN